MSDDILDLDEFEPDDLPVEQERLKLTVCAEYAKVRSYTSFSFVFLYFGTNVCHQFLSAILNKVVKNLIE